MAALRTLWALRVTTGIITIICLVIGLYKDNVHQFSKNVFFFKCTQVTVFTTPHKIEILLAVHLCSTPNLKSEHLKFQISTAQRSCLSQRVPQL